MILLVHSEVILMTSISLDYIYCIVTNFGRPAVIIRVMTFKTIFIYAWFYLLTFRQ